MSLSGSKTKYIFVTGGVVSGLVQAASRAASTNRKISAILTCSRIALFFMWSSLYNILMF